MNKTNLNALILLLGLSLGCKKESSNFSQTEELPSSSKMLSTASTFSGAYAKGADVGWLSEMEYYNTKFYFNDGTQGDCLDILKSKGINSIRFRVWVNPVNGWCNKNDVVTMATRANNKGLRVMIDFHYSDSWADPGKQYKPAAWTNLNFTDLTSAVSAHTTDVLNALKANGVTPEWVQVGNETNDGMLWEDGRASKSMKNFATLITAGYNAVKSVDPSIKVIVHISNGFDNSRFRWIFDGLKANGGKWDVIGMSLYPTRTNWQSLNDQCLANMKDMVTRYGSQVMVVEVGMEQKEARDCKSFITDLINKNGSLPNGAGLGVFYWEPENYNKWNGYTKGAFDATGKPSVAMDAFLVNPQPPAINYVQNPSFDAAGAAVQSVASWTEGGNAMASFVGGSNNGWNPDGGYYLGHYLASAYIADTYQTIAVPNGTYKLSAFAVGSSGFTERKMYARDFGGAELSVALRAMSAWTEVSIPTITVTTGQITVGFYSNAAAETWLDIDKVSLIQQ